jgi:hypothetical protein
MAHRKLKSCCKNRPGDALQLRLRQYRERPSGPSPYLNLSFIRKASKSSASRLPFVGLGQVLAYPDFTKPFDTYTDASTKQLGTVITQDNRPIAFFRRKLSGAQSKYPVTELELLAIVETLKKFKGMLWGQRLNVYTDHENLTRDGLGLTSDRVT